MATPVPREKKRKGWLPPPLPISAKDVSSIFQARLKTPPLPDDETCEQVAAFLTEDEKGIPIKVWESDPARKKVAAAANTLVEYVESQMAAGACDPCLSSIVPMLKEVQNGVAVPSNKMPRLSPPWAPQAFSVWAIVAAVLDELGRHPGDSRNATAVGLTVDCLHRLGFAGATETGVAQLLASKNMAKDYRKKFPAPLT